MSISIPEIIAAINKVSDPQKTDAFLGEDGVRLHEPDAAPFIAFCRLIYDRGLEHGALTKRDELIERMHRAGQSAAASIIASGK